MGIYAVIMAILAMSSYLVDRMAAPARYHALFSMTAGGFAGLAVAAAAIGLLFKTTRSWREATVITVITGVAISLGGLAMRYVGQTTTGSAVALNGFTVTAIGIVGGLVYLPYRHVKPGRHRRRPRWSPSPKPSRS